MRIKSIFGLCKCKGCMKKSDFIVDVKINTKDGKEKKKTVKLCITHAQELIKGGTLTGVTYSDNADGKGGKKK